MNISIHLHIDKFYLYIYWPKLLTRGSSHLELLIILKAGCSLELRPKE